MNVASEMEWESFAEVSRARDVRQLRRTRGKVREGGWPTVCCALVYLVLQKIVLHRGGLVPVPSPVPTVTDDEGPSVAGQDKTKGDAQG